MPKSRLFLSVAAQVHEEVYFQHRCKHLVEGGVESVFVDRTGMVAGGAAGASVSASDSAQQAARGHAMWNEAKQEPEAVRLMLQTLLRDVVAEERFMFALGGLGQEPVPRYRGLVLGLQQELARGAGGADSSSRGNATASSARDSGSRVAHNGRSDGGRGGGMPNGHSLRSEAVTASDGAVPEPISACESSANVGHRAGAALASAGGAFLEGVLEETLANILAELRETPGSLAAVMDSTTV